MGRPSRFSPEVRERAVRMVFDHESEYDSQWAAIRMVADKIGCSSETLRNWVRQAERDQGRRPGPSSEELAELKELRREVTELRRANTILRQASAYFAAAEALPPTPVMVAFIDARRDEHGVESICEVLPIAPSTYYEHKARQADRTRLPAREHADVIARGHVRRAWQDSGGRYGVRKVWKQLHRENVPIAKCTVRRLMRQMGLEGATRGRRWTTTTIADPAAARSPDLVERQFVAEGPNRLWVSDLTYVWTARRFVYTAFVIDVFSRRIVGWRTTDHLRTDLVLDALDQAVYDRLEGPVADGLTAHSDAGTQYTAMRYTDRLAEAGIAPSIGSVGDSFDNAMAESIIGLYKTEVINRRDRWDSLEQVEWETMRWVAWFNHDRIYEALGDIPPAEFEANHYRQPTPTELVEVM